MLSKSEQTFHLGLSADMVRDVDLVLLPGDPQRVTKIARYLEQAETLAHFREYHSVIGLHKGRRILVTSTGIGGPSAAIAVEELAMLGLHTFLRVGTTGAIQPDIEPGDLVIATAAVRMDGASRHIAPIEYPAVANFQLVHALMQAAQQKNAKVHCGVTASSDTFYQGQNRQDSFKKGFVIRELKEKLAELQALNVLSFEMEAATIFTQAACYGLRAGCVLGVLVNRHRNEFPSEETVRQTEENVISLAVEALNYL